MHELKVRVMHGNITRASVPLSGVSYCSGAGQNGGNGMEITNTVVVKAQEPFKRYNKQEKQELERR